MVEVGRCREEGGDWEREERSEGEGARRRIFLERRVDRWREEEKGGLRRPSLGVMRNFWWEGGMERSVEMVVERSVIVELGRKERVCGVLWWRMVRVMESAEGGGGGGGASVDGEVWIMSAMVW